MYPSTGIKLTHSLGPGSRDLSTRVGAVEVVVRLARGLPNDLIRGRVFLTVALVSKGIESICANMLFVILLSLKTFLGIVNTIRTE